MALLRALLLVPLLLAPNSLAPKTTPPLQKNKKFAELLERHAAFGFRGTVLVMDQGKQVLGAGVGIADQRAERDNELDTLFEIASLSKQVTAAAILMLEQEGKLGVEDTIDQHLPGVPEHSRKLTIHHLLTHTSGVPRENSKGRGPDLGKAVVDYLGDGPRAEPGKEWAYWNGGYALLAGIVEEVSAQSFQDYCREKLFLPAEMKDTGFCEDAHLDKKRAAAWEMRSAIDCPYGAYEWQYKGMGGVVTSAPDLWLWHRALMEKGLFEGEAREKLFASHVRDQAHGADYGYGWYVGRAPDGKRKVWHGGDVRGFHCTMHRYPDRDACIILLANSPADPLAAMADGFESLLFKSSPRRSGPPETETVKAKALRAYEGVYRAKGGEEIEIEAREGGLWLTAEGSVAKTLTGNDRVTEASFAVRSIGKDQWISWSSVRTLPFEFRSKRRKIVAVEASGIEFERVP